MKRLLFVLALFASTAIKAQVNPPKVDIVNYINQVIKNNPEVLIRGNVMNRILKEVLNYPVDTIWISADTLKYRQNGVLYSRLLPAGGGSGGTFEGVPLAIRNTGQGVRLGSLSLTADTLSLKRLSGAGGISLSVLSDSTVRIGGDSLQRSLEFADEGATLGTVGTVTKLNFTGPGVTASRSGNTIDVAITGGGGGGGDGNNFPSSVNLSAGTLTINRDGLSAITTPVTTTNVTEGTNLYFTNPRVRSALSGASPILFNNVTGSIGADTSILSTISYVNNRRPVSLLYDSVSRELRLTLANGTVFADTIQPMGDNWGNQVVARDFTLSGNGTLASPLGVDTSKVITPHQLEIRLGSGVGVSDTLIFFRIPGIDSLYIQVNEQDALGVYDSTGNSVMIQDEAADLGSATKINFVGSGVVTSVVNGVATVQIASTGGGGGGADGNNYPVSLTIINGVATLGRFGMSDITYSFSTSDIPEGVNQYFSNTRARNALSVTSPLTYNTATGQFGVDVPALQALIPAQNRRISYLQGANATNMINNANYTQSWQWNGLTEGTGLELSSFTNNITGSTLFSLSNDGIALEDAIQSSIGIYNGITSSANNVRKNGITITLEGSNNGVSSESAGLNLVVSGGSKSFGVKSLALEPGGQNTAYLGTSTNGLVNIGADLDAVGNSATNYGARVEAVGINSINYGIRADAVNPNSTNYAGFFNARFGVAYSLYTDSGMVRFGYLAGSAPGFVKVNALGQLYRSDSVAADITTGANLGTVGARVFAQKTGNNMEFRRIQAGTNITLVENPDGIVINAPSGSVYTGSNGLTLSGNNFKLGGTLTEGTAIDGAGQILSIGNTSITALSASGAINMSAGNTDITEVSVGSSVLSFARTFGTNSTTEQTALFIRGSTTSLEAGMAGELTLGVNAPTGGYAKIGGIVYTLTDPTVGSRDSRLEFQVVNNNVSTVALRLNSNLDVALPGYLAAREDGTTSKALYVDGSGNLRYGTIAGGGGSDGNNYPTTLTVNSGIVTLGRNGLADLTAAISTTHVTEGSNLYFTNARARSALSAGTGLSYNSGTGEFVNTAPDQTVTITAGANVTVTGSYPNFTVAASGSSVAAANGLTLSGGTIRLGGALSQSNTSITGIAGQNFSLSGVDDLHFAGSTVSLENNAGTAGYGIVSNQNEVFSFGANNSINSILKLSAETAGGSGANGMGGALDYVLPNSIGALTTAGRLITKWNNAGAESSTADLQVLNGGVLTSRFSVSSLGDVTISGYPNTRNDGATTSALYVDGSGNMRYGPVNASNGVFSARSQVGTATFWNAALDITDGNFLRNALMVGDAVDNTKRTITLSTVFFVPSSSFTGVGNWVQCGLITDASFRPTHTIQFRGSSIIDATKYKNSGNTNFTGTASYGDMNIRIDRNGQIFVYISSINTFAQLSGTNMVVVPINVTYFLTNSD